MIYNVKRFTLQVSYSERGSASINAACLIVDAAISDSESEMRTRRFILQSLDDSGTG